MTEAEIQQKIEEHFNAKLKEVHYYLEENKLSELELEKQRKRREKHRIAAAKYRKSHPELTRQIYARYRQKHAEKIRKREAEERRKNPQKSKEKAKRYREKNLQEIRKKDRQEYRKKHPIVIGKGRWRKPESVINDHNEEFKSIKHAAREHNVNQSSIFRACKNPNKISCGKRWTYKKHGIPQCWQNPANLKSYRYKYRTPDGKYLPLSC